MPNPNQFVLIYGTLCGGGGVITILSAGAGRKRLAALGMAMAVTGTIYGMWAFGEGVYW